MNSPRDLRRRIRSISGTAQITRAMQMVAASQMRKAQQAALDAAPFARLLYRIQRTATIRARRFEHPLLDVRPMRRRAVILLAADKGLCGALNSNVFRIAGHFDPQSTIFIAVGRKAAQYVVRTRRQLVAEFACHEAPTFPEAKAIAAFARDLFERGTVDDVRIVTTRCVNTLTQVAVALEYLPVGQIRGLKVPGVESEEAFAADPAETRFEPSTEAVLGYLLGHSLNIYMYYVLLNAMASEQSARMVAMKNATDSAEGHIKSLRLEYDKLRRGNIAKELLEIEEIRQA